MKNLINARVLLAGLVAIPFLYSCHREHTPRPVINFMVKQTNLVADESSLDAAKVDPNLVNAWGIAAPTANGPIWISSNAKGLSTVYDTAGMTLRPPVTIPSATLLHPGSPQCY
ncbi:MAG TPA: hypothetical protein VIM16_18080 [Mucilaginibacter sp.]|jgi:hypothetical protein